MAAAPSTCAGASPPTRASPILRLSTNSDRIEEAGPLRAIVLIKGKHRRPDGSGTLDLRGRITAYAGKSYIEVEHQFRSDRGGRAIARHRLDQGQAPPAGWQRHPRPARAHHRLRGQVLY